MEQTQQLAQRLREVILNGTWIANTNFKKELDTLSLELAFAPFGNLNTIGVLAQHIHYYIAGILNVFENGTLEIRDAYSFDFPPIETQEAWGKFLNIFWNDTEKLAIQIDNFPDEKLLEDFVNAKYGNFLRNIEGMIEHSYYHLGQIVLIKKMQSCS